MKKVMTPHTGLTARWVPVITADGRIRMEMRWSGPSTIGRRHAA